MFNISDARSDKQKSLSSINAFVWWLEIFLNKYSVTSRECVSNRNQLWWGDIVCTFASDLELFSKI